MRNSLIFCVALLVVGCGFHVVSGERYTLYVEHDNTAYSKLLTRNLAQYATLVDKDKAAYQIKIQQVDCIASERGIDSRQHNAFIAVACQADILIGSKLVQSEALSYIDDSISNPEIHTSNTNRAKERSMDKLAQDIIFKLTYVN